MNRTVKYLFSYVLFSGMVYFGSYALLHIYMENIGREFEQENRDTENLTLTKIVKKAGGGLYAGVYAGMAMEDLKAKAPLFFLFWPSAVGYVLGTRKIIKDYLTAEEEER